MTKQILRMIKNQQSEALIIKAVELEVIRIDMSKPRYVPCPTCELLVDDDTCPECNGEEQIIGSYEPMSKEELEKEVNKQLELIPEYQDYKRDLKNQELNSLVVEDFNAHMEALGNMGIVLAIASSKMWKKLIEVEPKYKPLYDEFYKTLISWKGADNKAHEVDLEQLIELAEIGMRNKEKIIFTY